MGRTLRGEKTKQVDESKLNDEQKQQYDKIKKMAENYKGKNENEIFDELRKTVNAGKKDGTVTDEKISNIASAISPMLNTEQRKKLEILMSSLRR